MSTLRVSNLSNLGGTKSSTSSAIADNIANSRAYGDFSVRGGDISSPTTVASSGQTRVPLTRSNSASGITLNTSTYQWTHATIGAYRLVLQYRQEAGGDTWTQFAVKDDTSNTIAGVSVRTGTAYIGNPSTWEIIYLVDSITDVYALYGWCAAGPITVRHSNYDGVSSPFSGTTSDGIKVLVMKVS
jgi:hypothetical protein